MKTCTDRQKHRDILGISLGKQLQSTLTVKQLHRIPKYCCTGMDIGIKVCVKLYNYIFLCVPYSICLLQKPLVKSLHICLLYFVSCRCCFFCMYCYVVFVLFCSFGIYNINYFMYLYWIYILFSTLWKHKSMVMCNPKMNLNNVLNYEIHGNYRSSVKKDLKSCTFYNLYRNTLFNQR